MTAGLAMQMRFRLGRLADRHGVTPALPTTLSLAPPRDWPVVVTGIAAHAGSIDADRQKFRPLALVPPLYRPMPPLLFRHDQKQIAGHIDELKNDADGNLKIRATITHEQARRCPAFSVAAEILAYEIRDEGSSNFFALITSARVVEVSVTPAPANSNALVQSRFPQNPMTPIYDHAIAGFELGIKALRLLGQHFDAPRAPAPRAPPAVISRRQTQFQSLVQAMNRADP